MNTRADTSPGTRCRALVVAFLLMTFPAAALPARESEPAQGKVHLAQAAPAVSVTLVSAEARDENREVPSYDRALVPFRKHLEKLDYDTFRHLNTVRVRAVYQEETELPAADGMSVLATPIEKQRDGRIKVRTRLRIVEERGGKRTAVNAATATSMVKPGDPLMQVMRLEDTTYVLLLIIDE